MMVLVPCRSVPTEKGATAASGKPLRGHHLVDTMESELRLVGEWCEPARFKRGHANGSYASAWGK